MCEVVSVWPQARKVERPNNSGVCVKGMNLSSTHLGVGAPTVESAALGVMEGAMRNPPPDAHPPSLAPFPLVIGKNQQPRSDTRCQPPHTKGGKRVRWRDGGANLSHPGGGYG